jgi:hypothetical protein
MVIGSYGGVRGGGREDKKLSSGASEVKLKLKMKIS